MTIKLVAMVFTRFADLFGAKVNTRGLIIYYDEEKEIYSEAFKLWSRKLSDLHENDFKTGITGIEQKAESMFREGSEMWPPSYAEFRALCFPLTTRDTLAHKPFERVLALEDHTAKAKRYELGIKESGSVLAMLGVSPASNYEGSSITEARARLDQARKMLEGANAN